MHSGGQEFDPPRLHQACRGYAVERTSFTLCNAKRGCLILLWRVQPSQVALKRHPDRGSCVGSCHDRRIAAWVCTTQASAIGKSGEAFTAHEHQFQDQVSKGRLVDA